MKCSACRLPDSDPDLLMMAARAMETSEYQIFFEAYRDWHGDAPPPRHIDALFGRYLSRGEAPAFVRHFVRAYLAAHPEVIRSFQAGQRRQMRAEGLSFGLIALMVLGAWLFF